MVQVTPVQVPTTTRDLKRNHLLRPGDLKNDALPAQAGTALGPLEGLLGRYLVADKPTGSALTAADVSDGPRLDYQVGPVVSIGLPLNRALAGVLEPHLRLDVYGTVKGTTAGATSPECIFSNATLLAVVKNETSGEPAIILILAPSEEGVPLDGALCRLVGAVDLFVVVRG